jgi:hypothetical protein
MRSAVVGGNKLQHGGQPNFTCLYSSVRGVICRRRTKSFMSGRSERLNDTSALLNELREPGGVGTSARATLQLRRDVEKRSQLHL